ncbi:MULTISPECIES: cellulose binding domain-containing protein [unclassified Solwaraspora]|uniref:cellulose binding domain-containing protein n=1 Tax=unclassified Solwaraspora TaxID=2627926 RepID=UPI00248D3A34|nr:MULTISPECIES: cellulose binding domain-containing protein [unclassified Solwaraspora]WBC00084.1 cellulose binding domain-containing protein [Solwaraspora sp. WMMA2059]WBC21371.1 cellulose binding domain-containing protein [Solwaraspora sp. WMMA2080]WJK36548.1 cellulose binding domain-containing protein [Solwaraspora sp. WMMA2065]
MVVILLVAAGCVPVQTRAIGESQPTVRPEPEPRVAVSPPAVNTGGQLVATAPPPSGEAVLRPAPSSSPVPSWPASSSLLPSTSATLPSLPSTPSYDPPRVTTPAAPSASAPAAAPDVIGRYRVLQQFGDGFIAEVLVMNTSRYDRAWTVTISFPDNVSRMHTAWVEGAPQATMRRSGREYVFTGSVPVGARSSVPLRFHFERHGHGTTPQRCLANGAPCDLD